MSRRKSRAAGELARYYAALGASTLSPAEHTALSLALLSSLDYIARGQHPGRAEWDDMADVVNVLDTLRAQGREPIDTADIEAVETAMAEAAARYKAGRPLRMDGRGLTLLSALVARWLDIARTMTRAEMQRLREDTDRRIRAAVKAGTCRVVDMEGCA